MVETAGAQIRELARRIHQGWKDHYIPTQGDRVRESARAYLEKLAANSTPKGEPGPGAAVSRPVSPRGQAPAPTLLGSITPDPRLVRNGNLLPDVGSARRAALQRLRSGTGKSVLGVPDSASIRAYAQLGATYFAEGFQNREAWKAKMRAELGDEVEANLDWFWQSTRESYESFVRRWRTGQTGGVGAPLNTRPAAPGVGATPPTELPVVSGRTGKAHVPGGDEVRPLGRPLSSNKREVTDWKLDMKARNYPRAEIEARIAEYFEAARDRYKDLAGKDNVFIPMPSTTGSNIIPETLANYLAKVFGGEVLPRESIRPVHTMERKRLDVYQRFMQPAEYEVTTDLSRLADKKKNVVIVDDLLTSGDSTEGLRHALRQQGIERTDVVTLASSQAATPRDLDRLSQRVAEKTGNPENVVRALVEAQLKQAPHRLMEGLFKKARDQENARAIYERLAGKRTVVPGNGG